MHDYSQFRIRSLDPSRISAPRNVSAADKKRCATRRKLEASLELYEVEREYSLDHLFEELENGKL